MTKTPLCLLALVLLFGSIRSAQANNKFIEEISASLDGEILVSLNQTLQNNKIFRLIESPDLEYLEKISQDESLKADLDDQEKLMPKLLPSSS